MLQYDCFSLDDTNRISTIPQYNIYAAYFMQSQERLMQQLPTKENTNEVSFNLFPNP
jgi:hypothetical protein